MAKGITKRSEDFSRWYQEVIAQAELAEHAEVVRGCMVIRPNGYAIWERIVAGLDSRIKATGHRNAYFPLFIPESFVTKEKDHIEGFAPECAVVTHGGGKKLEENLYVRPTSETIIGHFFAKWCQSWRDLPILLNQWANVVRWEMRPRLFLRTTEFLWQEGHTIHATAAEAKSETLKMLEVYREFAQNELAIAMLTGRKSESEKFAGADATYAIEALMQDGRALQAGTSHDLGQNFAKAFEVKFADAEGALSHPFGTSWGVSTRLIGALIMSHSDDDGLVLPPRVAETQVVIVPIAKEEERGVVMPFAEKMRDELAAAGVGVKLDDRLEVRPGAKFFEWEKKGVCMRLECGPRDVAGGQAVAVMRHDRSKESIAAKDVVAIVQQKLAAMQATLLDRNKKMRIAGTVRCSGWEEFKAQVAVGFAWAGWCGERACEIKSKEECKATIRCIPFEPQGEPNATCAICGAKKAHDAIFARSY